MSRRSYASAAQCRKSTNGGGTSATTEKCGGACGKPLSQFDWTVKCVRCEKEWHYRCAGFDDSGYKTFAKLSKNGIISYYCGDCKRAIASLDDRVSALEAQLNGNGGAGEVFSSQSPTTGGFNAELVTQVVTQVLEVLIPKITDIVKEAVGETAEKERKKLNLVLVGAPESDQATDKQNVEEMCGILDVPVESLVDVFRTGQQVEGRPRITKLKFKDSRSKHKFSIGFFRNRADISAYENCFVRHDLTYKERQQDFALRQQCKELRAQGKTVKMSKGKIVEKNS